MIETIDNETGQILPPASVPAMRPPGVPMPYNSPETGQLAKALAAAQAEMKQPVRTKPGHFGKYAPLEEVVRVLNDALPKHGLCWQQGLVTRGGDYFVRTYVRHESGEWIAADYPVIADRPGTQGFASGVTQARRYNLNLVFGLAAEDDDDGQAAQDAAPNARSTAKRAVAESSPVREAAIVAYRRIQVEIDQHELPEPMWPAADVAAIEKFDSKHLIDLRQRLTHKLQLKEMNT